MKVRVRPATSPRVWRIGGNFRNLHPQNRPNRRRSTSTNAGSIDKNARYESNTNYRNGNHADIVIVMLTVVNGFFSHNLLDNKSLILALGVSLGWGVICAEDEDEEELDEEDECTPF